jgi:hypothetical protein
MTRGETTSVAPTEQVRLYESLRQKDSCRTLLWRELEIEPPKMQVMHAALRNFQVTGQRIPNALIWYSLF